MDSEDKAGGWRDSDDAPIPTYAQAVGAASVSSQREDQQETGTAAERQGLLGQDGSGRHGETQNPRGEYEPPSIHSARTSLDDANQTSQTANEECAEDEALHRDMETMDMQDSSVTGASNPGLLSQLRKSLSFLQLPFSDYVYSRIPTVPDNYKPGVPLVARVVGLFILVSFVYVLFVSQIFTSKLQAGQRFDPESVRTFAQGNVDEARIRQYLKHITSFDHVAGSEGNYALGRWVQELFDASGMDQTAMLDYHVYLNYPKAEGRKVAIVDPSRPYWEAQLEEGPAYPDADPPRQQTLTFHGLSKSGNVTGPLIYVNYGSQQDFKAMEDSDISLKGAIILMRYYGTEGDRAMKVKFAQDNGAIGALIYSDPAQDGFVKGEVYPDGPWRPGDGVQRGTVGMTAFVAGDVLTPGWASVKDAKRIDPVDSKALPKIPSLPISWKDAQPLLQSLKGIGEDLSKIAVGRDWRGGVPDVQWFTGDQSSPHVWLQNEQDVVEKQPIYNVHGLFEGIESPGRKIMVGNHRDSWCFGSGDPGSGTAIMLEVINIFGQLRQLGWRPLRTIEFASWDAEEYNLHGSTEYVEDNIESLRENTIGYINVDVGVVGDKFQASGSPLFRKSLLHVLDRVTDPIQNETLRSIWKKEKSKLGGLGAGSDYVAFQDFAGVSSIDMGFEGPSGRFPYHSCYETFEWMDKFGDPKFQYHKIMAQVWALMILELADRPVLPYDLKAYARTIGQYALDLDERAGQMGAPWADSDSEEKFDMGPLMRAAELLTQTAQQFHSFDEWWTVQVFGRGGFETNAVAMQRFEHNERLMRFEKDLLDIPRDGVEWDQFGVPGREQYKHTIIGPNIGQGYEMAAFPAIRDAVDAHDWKGAQAQIEKTAKILTRAAKNLVAP